MGRTYEAMAMTRAGPNWHGSGIASGQKLFREPTSVLACANIIGDGGTENGLDQAIRCDEATLRRFICHHIAH